MHDINYDLLSFVSKSGSCTREAVWQNFGMGSYRATDALIDQLAADLLLSVSRQREHYQDIVSLTASGLDALAHEKQLREDRAAEKAEKAENKVQRIKDRKQDRRDKWLIGIVSACCGSVVTLCIEHFQEISVFFAELFRSLFH